MYKIETLAKKRVYKISTLHTPVSLINVKVDKKEISVNKTPVNVSIFNNSDPQVAQRVADLENNKIDKGSSLGGLYI